VTVNEPGLRVRRATAANSDQGTPVNLGQGTSITITPRSPGCTLPTNTYKVDQSSWIGPSTMTATPAANSPDPGLPYGNYDVCMIVGGKKRIENVTLSLRDGHQIILPNLTADPAGTSCP
jgi:hypothetical protein